MKPTRFSEGIIMINGKQYQKTFLQSSNWYARCPYCQEDMDDLLMEDQIVHCDKCGKDFVAEFNDSKLL